MNIEVADALMDYLGAKGPFVIEAEHMCMSMRGVRKPGTATLTTVACGPYLKQIRISEIRLIVLWDYKRIRCVRIFSRKGLVMDQLQIKDLEIFAYHGFFS